MEMEIKEITCIIIGCNHHNTLGVIRALGFRNIKTYVILISHHQNNYVLYSKFINHYQLLSSPSEIVQHLLKIKEVFIPKPVVISCADIATAELDSHYEELSKYYYLPVAGGNINKLMNKQFMAEIAARCHIITPQNCCLSDIYTSGNRGGYILKPKKSIEVQKPTFL